MSNVTVDDLKKIFLQDLPLIDVRAPVEFFSGTLPGAVNLPIMDDTQRAAVGTVYKKEGREEAIRLGHELVSGSVKEDRLRVWGDYIRKNPEAVLFCFRGGLRSKITQRWLSEIGIERPVIEGGYKVARQYMRESIDQASKNSFLILSGPSGSAKTAVLKKASLFYPSLDLEGLACHRGSAFGAMNVPQPTQIDFEHAIAKDLLKLKAKGGKSEILVEDESRLIGRCALPESLFFSMRASGLLYIDEVFEQRIENVFQDYVLRTPINSSDKAAGSAQFQKYMQAIKMISKKLGGARTQEVMKDLVACENDFLKDFGNIDGNRIWIGKLLKYYYDPAYAQSFKKRDPKILIRGSSSTILDYLKSTFSC